MNNGSRAVVREIRLKGFRQFKDFTLNNINGELVITGANGSGKTTLLWGIIMLLRGTKCRSVNSRHQNSQHVDIDVQEIATLLNNSAIETTPLKYLLCSTEPPDARFHFELSGDVAQNKVQLKMINNSMNFFSPNLTTITENSVCFYVSRAKGSWICKGACHWRLSLCSCIECTGPVFDVSISGLCARREF